MSTSPAEYKRIEAAGYQTPYERDCCGRCSHSVIESKAPAFRCGLHRIPVAKLGICKSFDKAGADNDNSD